MVSSLTLLLIVFTGGVYALARTLGVRIECDVEKEVAHLKQEHDRRLSQQHDILQEKSGYEAQSANIFMLYEITKTLTKSFDEEETIALFEQMLKDNVTFKECHIVDPLSPKVCAFKRSPETFTFELKSKSKKLGYLALTGVKEKDKEKIMILGHQLALALRRIKLYQEIEKLAITDSLTDIFTRRYLIERFTEELRRSRLRKTQLSILMVDVDHFKKCNDRFGHIVGDQVLKSLADIMKANLREIDILGRYGGEEFCVVLPETDKDGALFVAERIRLAVEHASIRAYDTTVKVSVSVGISTYPDNGKNTNELIDKSDWALYRAKKMGRNQICAFGLYESN